MRLVFLLSTPYPVFSLPKIHPPLPHSDFHILPHNHPSPHPVLGAQILLPFHFELMYDVEYADVVRLLIMYFVLLTVQHLWLYT